MAGDDKRRRILALAHYDEDVDKRRRQATTTAPTMTPSTMDDGPSSSCRLCCPYIVVRRPSSSVVVRGPSLYFLDVRRCLSSSVVVVRCLYVVRRPLSVCRPSSVVRRRRSSSVVSRPSSSVVRRRRPSFVVVVRCRRSSVVVRPSSSVVRRRLSFVVRRCMSSVVVRRRRPSSSVVRRDPAVSFRCYQTQCPSVLLLEKTSQVKIKFCGVHFCAPPPDFNVAFLQASSSNLGRRMPGNKFASEHSKTSSFNIEMGGGGGVKGYFECRRGWVLASWHHLESLAIFFPTAVYYVYFYL